MRLPYAYGASSSIPGSATPVARYSSMRRRSDQTGELIPVDVAVGDIVVYSKYGGTEITVDGEDLLILTSRDVLAKVVK